jgi:hypothetical protein
MRLPAVAVLALACLACPGSDTTGPSPSCVGTYDLSCGKVFKGSVCVPLGQLGFFCQLPCKTNADCAALGHAEHCGKTEFGSFCQSPASF